MLFRMTFIPMLILCPVALAADTKVQAPINDEEVLVMKHTGGWGAGVLAEFRLKASGDFEYTERVPRRQVETVRGRLADEQIKALVRAVADAKDGPAAEDAGVVEIAWRDGEKVGLRMYSMPKVEPAAGLMAAIKDAANKAVALPPAAGQQAPAPSKDGAANEAQAVNGLKLRLVAAPLAAAPAGAKPVDLYLRWENTRANEALSLLRDPCCDLYDHVFVKGPDGALLPARKDNRERAKHPASGWITLEAGKTENEQFDPWHWVVKPEKPGKYDVWVEFEMKPEERAKAPLGVWEGKVVSNRLAIDVAPPPAPRFETGALPGADAERVLGREGWLLIRSQARLEQVIKLFEELGWKGLKNQNRPSPLTGVDFDRQMVVGYHRFGDEGDTYSATSCTGDAGRLSLSLLRGFIIYKKRGAEVNRCMFILAVVPKAESVETSLSCWTPMNGGALATPEKARKEASVTFDRDIAGTLAGSIKAEKNAVNAGDDIRLVFTLEQRRMNDLIKDAPVPVVVWDGKYSNGYRNHAFLVETPDGKTQLLRPAEQPNWEKNAPHPVEITQGRPYTLPDWAEGNIWKSLKALGLDTTKPGVYRITCIYQEKAEETDGLAAKKPDGGKYQMWGGNIATNTLEVRVKPVPAPQV